MPLSRIQRPAFQNGDAIDADHYFARVHGDVASLQARIERGFADYAFERAPSSELGVGVQQAVESLSRIAGPCGLIWALGAVAYLLI